MLALGLMRGSGNAVMLGGFGKSGAEVGVRPRGGFFGGAGFLPLRASAFAGAGFGFFLVGGLVFFLGIVCHHPLGGRVD